MLTFHNIFTLDPNALFAALVPLPEGGGELVFGDGVRYPFLHALEAPLGHVKASQLFFHFPGQEKIPWCQVRRIGWVGKQLDLLSGQPVFDKGGVVDGCVVQMQEPVSLSHLGPLLPQVDHELAQDHQDVVSIGGGPLQHDVGVNRALTVKEHQQHLFCPAGMDSGLVGAWFSFFDPVL